MIGGLLSAFRFEARTLGARKLLRREGPSAVQREEHGVVDGAKGFQLPWVAQGLEHVVIKWEEFFGRDRIERLADVIFGGDLLEGKEALGVALSLGLLHRFLRGEEGRRWREENGERAQADVLHGVWEVVAGAPIGPGAGDLAPGTDLGLPRVETPGASLRWKSGISGLR